jgi:7-cyano-7-deazaguanine synthase
MKKAVILLSGGVDSTTTLAVAQRDGFECYAISFDYGQRHRYELQVSAAVAERMSVKRHLTVPVDLRGIGGSALTDDVEVPTDRNAEDMAEDIPATYVPARNTIFLSIALGWAEVLGAFDIFFGANAVDYSGYPDCRPEYISAFESLANLATKAGVEAAGQFRVHAPLLLLAKADIIRTGVALGVDYRNTYSCYAPADDGAACGRCDSCLLRLKGFEDAGIADPTRYQSV